MCPGSRGWKIAKIACSRHQNCTLRSENQNRTPRKMGKFAADSKRNCLPEKRINILNSYSEMDNGEFLTPRWIFLLRAGFSYSEMIFVLRVLRDGFLYSQPKGPIFDPGSILHIQRISSSWYLLSVQTGNEHKNSKLDDVCQVMEIFLCCFQYVSAFELNKLELKIDYYKVSYGTQCSSEIPALYNIWS